MPSRGPCFPVSTLGFTSDFDRLIITVDPSPSTTDQAANIYTSLPKSGLIAFKLRVDKLSTESIYDESNLIFGFVDIDQLPIRKQENQAPGAYFGRLIYISALEHTSPVILLKDWLPSNAPIPTPLPTTFDLFVLGTTATVTFNFNEHESKVVIGENSAFSQTLDISGLNPNYRVFWIGYATSETGTIRAEISNFTIEQP